MEKHKITGIIIFISVISLFLAGPVQAMRVISEEDLDRVTAEEGITMGMDVTAYSTATSLSLYQNSGTNVDGILLSDLYMVKKLNDIAYGANEAFRVKTDMILDVGSSGTKTWLNLSGMSFPDYQGNVSSTADPYGAPNAVSLYFSNLRAQDRQGADATYTLAYNVHLYGMYIGRDVNLWTSGSNYRQLRPGDTFMRISNREGGGLELIAEQAMLARYVMIRPNNADTHRFWVDGILMAENTDFSLADGAVVTFNAIAAPESWPHMSGNARIGGELPYYSYNSSMQSTKNGTISTVASIDIGSSGSDTLLQVNLPMAFSMRWKNLKIDERGGKNLETGPSLTLNASLWTLRATLKNTY